MPPELVFPKKTFHIKYKNVKLAAFFENSNDTMTGSQGFRREKNNWKLDTSYYLWTRVGHKGEGKLIQTAGVEILR